MSVVSDLIAKGYEGYRGWGEAEAQQDFQKTGGAGKYSGGNNAINNVSSGGGDYNSFLQSQQEMQRAAIQPAIQSLQASQPEITAKYTGAKTRLQDSIAPLTERYNNLIAQIKGTGQTSVNRQTVVTANELGKRGIEGSSTLAGQEIQNAVSPIEQQTQGLVKDTGYAQEADIRDINSQMAGLSDAEIGANRDITSQIAQLQASGGQSAIQGAIERLRQQQSQADNAAQLALQQAGLGETTRSNKASEALRLMELNKPSVTQTQGNKDQATKQSLLNDISGGWTLADVIKKYGSTLSTAEIVQLYSGASPFGTPKEDWAKEILGINGTTTGYNSL